MSTAFPLSQFQRLQLKRSIQLLFPQIELRRQYDLLRLLDLNQATKKKWCCH